MRGHLRAALISINNVTSPGRRTPDDFIRDMSSANDIARKRAAVCLCGKQMSRAKGVKPRPPCPAPPRCECCGTT